MSFARAALLLLVALHVSAQATESADARQWLTRLASAGDGFAYRGTLIYESGDQTEALRVTHGTVDGRPYDYLEHLDGNRREVIRSGSSVTCVLPGQRLTRLLHNQQRSGMESIETFYTLSMNGEGRVAGRPVLLLEAMPRDSFRLGYRIAFDRDTGVALRYEQFDARQRVLERFQFAEIEFSDKLLPQWRLAESDGETAVAAAAADTSAPVGWQPRWLPPGFVAVTTTDGDDRDGQTYSDGLGMLSIFVAESDGTFVSTGGKARQGATVAHTAPLRRSEQTFVVTVIGEVPAITAQRVADAVTWQEPAQ